MASGRGTDEFTDKAWLPTIVCVSFTAILFGRTEAETDELMHFLPILGSVTVIDQ